MPDRAFTSDVMSISVEGLAAAQNRLNRAARGVQPEGLLRPMTLAVGQTHRYLLGLSRSGTPPTAQGILPVVTGRLRNSFFWTVQRRGASVLGIIGSNVLYGPRVEPRRRFLARTIRDQEGPINNILAAHVQQVTR